jgi:hypothetical protein
MLLIQDIHIVIGREEMPFEDLYRTELAPAIATDPGTRLAAFFWAPHGGGEGYEAVTLTAAADLDAIERHQDRTATGDLARLWGSLEAKQREIQSSLGVLASSSALANRSLDDFTPGEHPTAVFRLDAFRAGGAIADAVAGVEEQIAGGSAGGGVSVVGCWSPFLGELDEPVVWVLNRVVSDEALRSLVAEPGLPWSGVPRVVGAARTTRLLRSVTWSPIH